MVLRKALQSGLQWLEGKADEVFGPAANPFYFLGALGYYFFWIAAVSGIILYIFFETSAQGAFESVERMTNEQWYFAGLWRSFHRYSSDALVLVTLGHMARELILDRYRGVRWFAWVSGVPVIWLLYVSGISGYWLVWDKLAQYLAIASMEWLDWFGIFGQSVARNFLTRGSLDDRFFTLLVFLHIAVPLFLLFGMWIHVLRISRPVVNAPRVLALGTGLMLFAISAAEPAVSQGAADLGVVVASLNFDWFYMIFYPIYDWAGAGLTWAVAGGTSALLLILPWLPVKKYAVQAMVTPESCNGCSRCFADCPFGAITMTERTDGRPHPRIATVDHSICTGCGICVGACPTSTPFRSDDALVTGIDLGEFPLRSLRQLTDSEVARVKGDLPVMVVGCEQSADPTDLREDGVATLTLPCVAMLPPSFIDYLLTKNGFAGVLLTGCREGGCYHRFGVKWTEQRIARERAPQLRERVARERLRTCWAAEADRGKLARELAAFRADLVDLEVGE